MTVQIVVDGPGRPAGRRLRRAVAIVVSLPLVLIGVVGAYATLLMAMAIGYEIFGGTTVSAKDRRETIIYTAVCVGALLLGLVGIRLIRGKRRLVLFLRRFGYEDATTTLSFAAQRAMGRSWRLVTFDDSRVQAVGGRASSRRLAALFGLVLAGFAGWGLWYLVTEQFNKAKPNSSSTSTDHVGNVASQAFSSAIGVAFAIVISFFLVLILTTVLGGSALMLAATYGFAHGSERAKRDRIVDEQDVARRPGVIARRSMRIFAPRLVVVTVANPVWRPAVQAFAHTAAAIIVDVSIPSESLYWEISTLLPVYGRRCVFVGALDRVAAAGPGGQAVFASPLAAAIDGNCVLAYQHDRRGVTRFSRALRQTIEARQ